MAKTTKDYFVRVPRVTLETVKNMLYGETEGVDISGIAQDLFTENDELGWIHLALAFKHKLPKWDMSPRYTNNTKYVPLRFSFIYQRVWCEKWNWNESKEEYVLNTFYGDQTEDISWFMDLSTKDPHTVIEPSDEPF